MNIWKITTIVLLVLVLGLIYWNVQVYNKLGDSDVYTPRIKALEDFNIVSQIVKGADSAICKISTRDCRRLG